MVADGGSQFSSETSFLVGCPWSVVSLQHVHSSRTKWNQWVSHILKELDNNLEKVDGHGRSWREVWIMHCTHV